MAFVRSAVYVTALGGLGYILLKVFVPDENKIDRSIYPEGRLEYRNETLKKRQAIVDVLRGAAERPTPMYRQTREEIDASKERDLGRKGP